MSDLELSSLAKDMLTERNLLEDWTWRTISTPDDKWKSDDDNVHCTRAVEEREGRVLHVVVNPNAQPNRIVTVFFDRRLGRRK